MIFKPITRSTQIDDKLSHKLSIKDSIDMKFTKNSKSRVSQTEMATTISIAAQKTTMQKIRTVEGGERSLQNRNGETTNKRARISDTGSLRSDTMIE